MSIKEISDYIFNNLQKPGRIQEIFFDTKDILSRADKKVFEVIGVLFLEPLASSAKIMHLTGMGVGELKETYNMLKGSRLLGLVFTSNYHPLSLMMQYSNRVVKDFATDHSYFERVLRGGPVSPRELEIHVTRGSCNYRCRMCLWRAGQKGVGYTPKEIKKGILSVEDWKKVLTEAKELGTKTVIFSGGGEPTLREEGYLVMAHARGIGLKSMTYTNGSKFLELSQTKKPFYTECLKSDRIRISMHGASDETYNRIANLNSRDANLRKTISGIKALILDRKKTNSNLKVGIGFVIQHLNVHETQEIAQLAGDLKVDFLDLRTDSVNMTRTLSMSERNSLQSQLCGIREDSENGFYADMSISFTDNLLALANNWNHVFTSKPTKICRAYFYRAAINPFGRVATCDLMAEPHYARSEFSRGVLKGQSYRQIVTKDVGKKYPGDKCAVCLPGQKVLNALLEKLIVDADMNIMPKDQFLGF